jgi:YVTN family beta-propeller protein
MLNPSVLASFLGAALAGAALVHAVAAPAAAQTAYTNFETVPVRPLALSPDGSRLFAVNPPDGRLEIFEVTWRGLRHRHSVAVGLEPVAVAARTRSEVWVVNHLSDSVSVVDVGADPPRVVRTLLVGDEPWDVVFAGPREEGERGAYTRAFVSAARRGQNHPEGPNAQQKTPGIGRADVWVFDARELGAPLGGTPEAIVQLFGDKPRGLAASPDGATVYAAVFHSGNRTTALSTGAVCDGGASRGPCRLGQTGADDPPVEGEPGTGNPPVLPGGLPAPNQDAAGNPAPESGLIVRYDEASKQWRDELGRNWNGAVPFSLPDLDVFAIDATADPPQQVAAWPSVGTVLFGLEVHRSGRVYVANSEARNEVRFEGPGVAGTTVRGHLHESRISVLGQDGSVRPRHLNKHIDYDVSPVPEGVRERSLSTPTGLAFSPGGTLVYVAALGSDAVGVLRVGELDRDRFAPSAAAQIPVPGGPAGLLVDRLRSRLYVYTRFDNAIATVDTRSRREVARVTLPDVEPEVVTAGRRFLYDARLTSGNGEASCGVCHVFGDKDDLAWDLGNPDAVAVPNRNPFLFGEPSGAFHPMKGPMTTQTLRGMDHHGPMHWRGDRTGADDPASGDAMDELAAFRAFNVAFDGLLGRDQGPLPPEDMQAFAEFALTIFPPPNPIRPLDNRNTGTLAEGARTYTNVRVNLFGTCDTCHRLSPLQGFFGTQGMSVFDPGDIKMPHLRNAYDKVGAFGIVAFNPLGNSGALLGDQIRGFGLHHSGSLGDIGTFLTFGGFVFPDGPAQKAAVEDFVIAFPSNLAPIVGQQVTRGAQADAAVDARIDLLVAQAGTEWVVLGNAGRMSCDLVVKGVVGGEARGFVWDPAAGVFLSDRAGEPGISDADLRAVSEQPGQSLTYTCATPGSGLRVGVDRDADGWRDRDELDLGTDPDAAGSAPGACADEFDNDGDGAVDWPADPDCASADGDSELAGPHVEIDIEPGSRKNAVRLDARARVSVAVLGSDTVDVRNLDLGSLAFGPAGATPHGRGHKLGWLGRRDVNRDGHPDQVVAFDADETGLAPGDTTACLSGEIAGAGFRACDEVEVRDRRACRGGSCR